MMEAWVPLAVFAVVFGVLMIGLSRYQTSRYQTYLSRHTETTHQMLEEQRRTQDAITRQTAALERIATALEQRS
jgi:altronate dehydratase